MAIVTVNFFSESLLRNVNIKVILPVDKRKIDGECLRSKEKKFKTLYLLHGLHGCESDWITGTRISRWAQERNLVVVMPAGENSFYNDNLGTHDNFGKFVSEELVEFTRAAFRLSEEREDTFIGGNSMGALGALYAGFRHPETFGYICAVSAALIGGQYPVQDEPPYDLINNCRFNEAVFGKEEDYKGGKNDYYALIKSLVDSNQNIPKIYMSAGKQDPLLPLAKEFVAYLDSLGVAVDYFEKEGGHNWEFWDREIVKVLDWLPLEK